MPETPYIMIMYNVWCIRFLCWSGAILSAYVPMTLSNLLVNFKQELRHSKTTNRIWFQVYQSMKFNNHQQTQLWDMCTLDVYNEILVINVAHLTFVTKFTTKQCCFFKLYIFLSTMASCAPTLIFHTNYYCWSYSPFCNVSQFCPRYNITLI